MRLELLTEFVSVDEDVVEKKAPSDGAGQSNGGVHTLYIAALMKDGAGFQKLGKLFFPFVTEALLRSHLLIRDHLGLFLPGSFASGNINGLF